MVKENSIDLRKLVVGGSYFFETCTKDWIGRVIEITGPHDVILEEASWVANSGRLHVFISKGTAEGMEIEPVGIRAVQWLGWIPWPHSLFTEAV